MAWPTIAVVDVGPLVGLKGGGGASQRVAVPGDQRQRYV